MISHIKNRILEIMSWKDDYFIIFLKVYKLSFEEMIFPYNLFSFLFGQNYGRFGIIFPNTVI